VQCLVRESNSGDVPVGNPDHELREGFVAGTAPLAGNPNYQGSMHAGTLFGLGEALGAGVFISSFELSLFTATVSSARP
jgi:hypothetical protein